MYIVWARKRLENDEENETMKRAKYIVLECRRVWYYGNADEEMFFLWIDRIASIKVHKGVGDTLYLYVDPKAHEFKEFLSLRELFSRYGIDDAQLAPLDRKPPLNPKKQLKAKKSDRKPS